MGLIWGRQGPDGPYVSPMYFAIWVGYQYEFKFLMWEFYYKLCVNWYTIIDQMLRHGLSDLCFLHKYLFTEIVLSVVFPWCPLMWWCQIDVYYWFQMSCECTQLRKRLLTSWSVETKGIMIPWFWLILNSILQLTKEVCWSPHQCMHQSQFQFEYWFSIKIQSRAGCWYLALSLCYVAPFTSWIVTAAWGK